MRITLEPTTKEGLEGEYANPKVIVELPNDDVDAEDALDFVKRALIVWGYHWTNIMDEE